jgi:hypothetical protein
MKLVSTHFRPETYLTTLKLADNSYYLPSRMLNHLIIFYIEKCRKSKDSQKITNFFAKSKYLLYISSSYIYIKALDLEISSIHIICWIAAFFLLIMVSLEYFLRKTITNNMVLFTIFLILLILAPYAEKIRCPGIEFIRFNNNTKK